MLLNILWCNKIHNTCVIIWYGQVQELRKSWNTRVEYFLIYFKHRLSILSLSRTWNTSYIINIYCYNVHYYTHTQQNHRWKAYTKFDIKLDQAALKFYKIDMKVVTLQKKYITRVSGPCKFVLLWSLPSQPSWIME